MHPAFFSAHKRALDALFFYAAQIRTFTGRGGDSPPTYYSILSNIRNCENARFSPLHHRFTVYVETLCFHRSRPVYSLHMALFRRFTAARRFWTFLSNSLLSVPAAYRSDQNWTHLPKIGEVDLSESPIWGRPFRGAKLRCQLMAENSALLCLERFFSKIGKTAEAIKTELSVLP